MTLLAAIRQILGFSGAADAPPSNNIEAQAAYDPDGNRAVPLAIAARGLIGADGVPISAGDGAPGGTGTQLQFRDGTALGGIAGSSWDGSTLTLPGGSYGGSVLSGNNIVTNVVNAASYQLSTNTILSADSAGVLALRNGANSQAFSVSNSYTDGSNYRRIDLLGDFAGTGAAGLILNKAGTGGDSNFYIGNETSGGLIFRTVGYDRWIIDTSGHWKAATDNTYDIGASGANRPRSGYFASDLNLGTSLVWTGKTIIQSPSDGNLLLRNNASLDFNSLQFGGTTNAFPALKRNGTGLEVKLADDSGTAPLTVQTLTLNGSPTGTAPTDTATPVDWVQMSINGANYFIPLYQ